ncbi:MAG TPA: conjugal transfer protein TrbL, partial [Afipia sp.]|nr:conjugal transfer protein TrbL [Afipia sp.]
RARVGLRAASWTQSAEFRRLADQLRNSGVPPAQSGGGRP